MLKSCKTEINPTKEQKQIIRKTIGVCRYVYNFYLARNKEIYETEKRFVSGADFSKWLNNEYIPNNKDYRWIKEVSSKSVKQSIMNGEKSFKRFFKGQSHFPKFKKKNKSNVKMYFVKTDSTVIISCERHRIKIPTLGWVKLKEKGYIPTNYNTHIIKSGTVSYKAGKYYVSVLVEEQECGKPLLNNFGIGIDLGIKDFAICSNGNTYKNINKTNQVKKLQKKLKREQRSLSRKYEDYKKLNKNEREVATRQNIQKQKLKVQRLHHRLDNMRTDYINKIVSELVKTKPMWITIEDLNIKGMMKNRHLSKAIQEQSLYEFYRQIQYKSSWNNIRFIEADRYFPSSKLCHECGCVNKNLKLSDRTYICHECGNIIDRDYQASLNLKTYGDNVLQLAS